MDHVTYRIDPPQRKPAPGKFGRPNALRNAQVLPPHQVDLTLSPNARDDVRLPATISGLPMAKRAS